MTRIFLVEDDKAIAKNLTLLSRSEDFTVTRKRYFLGLRKCEDKKVGLILCKNIVP
jgi:DNA-binding response OmpR family regulator